MSQPYEPIIKATEPPERQWVRYLVGGVILIIIILLLARACGGDDDDDGGTEATGGEATPTADGTPAATATPAPSEPSPADIVTQLQTDLAELGYYSGPINGVYDEATSEAVRAFQEFAGIAADGVFGPETAAALDVAVGRSGSTMALQSALAALCYYDGPIDGDFGPGTTAALSAFQIDAGLDPDGLYGPATADALVAAWPSRPASCSGADPDAGATPTPTSETTDPADGSLSAVTATIEGTTVNFPNDVSCVLGADDAGSVQASADDGTTINVTLDGTASRVVIDGPAGSYDAPATSVSNTETLLTVEAAPPPIQVVVTLASCSAA